MMNWSIDIAPLIPMPFFWGIIIIALALVVVMVLRGTRGALFRALALAAIIGALANPTLQEEQRENLGNIALVVIDESTSQTLAQRPEQTAALRAQLENRLGQIDGLEVKWVVSSRPRDNVKAGTTLFTDLNEALADIPTDRLAGVLMVTDGQVHDVPSNIARLGFDAPVHALLTGKKGEFDRRIEVLEAPRYGIVGQLRDIEIALRQSGTAPASADTTVQVKVRREGEPDQMYSAQIGSKMKLPMLFPHAGQNIVEIELSETKGELTTANNRVVIIADGVRENLRVLLVSGKPHAGERTWRNLLKSDAAVDLCLLYTSPSPRDA